MLEGLGCEAHHFLRDVHASYLLDARQQGHQQVPRDVTWGMGNKGVCWVIKACVCVVCEDGVVCIRMSVCV